MGRIGNKLAQLADDSPYACEEHVEVRGQCADFVERIGYGKAGIEFPLGDIAGVVDELRGVLTQGDDWAEASSDVPGRYQRGQQKAEGPKTESSFTKTCFYLVDSLS